MSNIPQEDLNKKAKEISEKARDALACCHNLPSVLYHFTSLPTLKNILENKSIRFSHYKCLNDETELNYAWIGIEKISSRT